MRNTTIAMSLAVAAALGACGTDGDTKKTSAGLPQGGEAVTLKPADFTTNIDNPYWPMTPGTRWTYRETAPDGTRQKVVVTVTGRTKRIANGITARVVRDTASEDGAVVEDTLDWYAQDRAGSIWYLGEATKEYENGKFKSAAGSFEAGVNGAQPGIIMPAKPAPGMAYRQEYYRGQAEDRGSIFSLGEQAEVPAGHYKDVVMTRDLNPLKPKSLEYKFFARGVGPVLAIGISGGDDREELVRFERGG
jgi:hypothetical protein